MNEQEVIERVFGAPIDLVWELWTTAEGIATWFGPKGFTVKVDAIDLRVGGSFVYTMTKDASESEGPSSFSVESTFTVVERPHRLVYESPWRTEMMSTDVTLSETAEGVKLVLIIGATKPGMTGGAAKGWHSSLDRLAETFASRA
ncbi:MAG: SRPBCC domain-containing protein [Myxococcota bacterium]